jgi:precorrin-3B C17-methyltransferase
MELDHRSRGQLFLIGLGPGSPELLTPEASEALRVAEVVVGYRGYLERIADRLGEKEVRQFALGQEVERAEMALRLAESGRRVALVSSGDIGVYGMGGVALELAASRGTSADVVTVPGITAALAAAARLGAPLAHDWACISLSDLLTPWPVIARRLRAAADADFVVALYNPRSRARADHLRRAAECLLGDRSTAIPVGVVDNAYREHERIEVITLFDLLTERVDVGMFSMVIVGNSRTFVARDWMITPRIYAAKRIEGRTNAPPPAFPSPAPPRDKGGSGGVCSASIGDQIMAQSLGIIDRELGPEPSDPPTRAILRRAIHATADFDFAHSFRFSPEAIVRALEALRASATILTDVEMLRAGVRRDLAGPLGVRVCCGLNSSTGDETTGLTRSAAGLRRTFRTLGDGVVVAIGNAPTALDEALRLVESESWRPACLIGIPVGFVGVEESKRRLMEQDRVPYITSVGRKGGTAVTAAVVNALLELASSG